MLQASENKGSMQIIAVTVLTNLNEIDLQEMGFDKTNSLENLVLKKAQMALECKLDGVVASAQEAQNLRKKLGQNFLIVTPGIRAEKILNDDQKRVADVKTALASGASYLVVGRPITQSENPYLSAQKFIKLINEFAKNS
jgi:orotidine-5'-phosphate decarboxylase